jgi:plastocyanin
MGITALTLLVLACGSGGDDDNGGGGNGGSAQATTAPSAQAQTLTIRAGDWFFEPNNWRVRAGAPVNVTFQSTGPMFPHTFAIKNLNGEGELFTSDRFENGQTGNFTFTVAQPGTYRVICVIRGHEDRGQTGTLTVTAQ